MADEWVESLKTAKFYVHEEGNEITISTSEHTDKARGGYRMFFIGFHGGGSGETRRLNAELCRAFVERANRGIE